MGGRVVGYSTRPSPPGDPGQGVHSRGRLPARNPPVERIGARMHEPQHISPGVVAAVVSMDCADDTGNTSRLDVGLGYDPVDPYAVTLTFRSGGCDVAWTFARELLWRGLASPTGDGDVQVWPSASSTGPATVNVQLSSPEGVLEG